MSPLPIVHEANWTPGMTWGPRKWRKNLGESNPNFQTSRT